MSSLFEWLRRNSEHYLIEAAQADMARRYLGRMPSPPVDPRSAQRPGAGFTAAFWRRVYVPVYRRIPWSVRRRLIVAMPGSHRRSWQGLRDPGRPSAGTAGSAGGRLPTREP